jgi:ribonucleoside-diphosphate reductase alpha chain
LRPRDHLVMQAAVQKFVDSSISKTINCPSDMMFEDFKEVYTQAYDLGCKGCTTYRPNEITGAVLEAKREMRDRAQAELPLAAPAGAEAKPKDLGDAAPLVYLTEPLDRPASLEGATYKVNWPESDHALYITINDVIQDGRRRPFEVFINSKNTEHYAWTVALTRMISAVFRRGGDVSFVVDELKAVFDPRGGHWMGGKYVPSLLAAIGDVIENHMIRIGFITPPGKLEEQAVEHRRVVNLGGPGGAPNIPFRQCPKCGQAGLVRQENCDTCTGCGYSKCS